MTSPPLKLPDWTTWPGLPALGMPAAAPPRPAAGVDSGPAPAGPEAGRLARQVARAAGSFEHSLLGRTPTSVTVVGGRSWMVVHLHEPFSPLERRLARADAAGAERVREFHRGLFDRSVDALLEHVRVRTGMEFRGAIAHVDTATFSVVKTLSTIADLDLFELGRGLPALGVPVNDHRHVHGTVEAPLEHQPGRSARPARHQEAVRRPASEPSAADSPRRDP